MQRTCRGHAEVMRPTGSLVPRVRRRSVSACRQNPQHNTYIHWRGDGGEGDGENTIDGKENRKTWILNDRRKERRGNNNMKRDSRGLRKKRDSECKF